VSADPPASPAADGTRPDTRPDTRPVRPGEEIPVEALAGWLAHEGLSERLGLGGPLEIEQFPGGHSNLTYLVRAAGRELVLRRPPVGSKVRTAHDMGREFRVLSRLPDQYPKAPRALAACDDSGVIGAPFYLMERVRGVILRGAQPPRGVALPPDRMRAVAEAAIDGLAELHAVDPAAAGLADLGRPEGYVERQVTGWSERWRAARTDDAADLADMDRAATWLADNRPPKRPDDPAGQRGAAGALIHNDYKYDNLVLDPDDLPQIRAVLDWEMATLGDPWMDVGTTLGYWIDPDDDPAMQVLPSGPTTLPGNLSRAELAARYEQASGRPPVHLLFFYVFGLFKIAVIAQQIYFRFRQGLTKDQRFAAMLPAVRMLGRTAARAIELGRIDRLG
jgi:aminoglycoside phosphotransferase (APT) family kinase protein